MDELARSPRKTTRRPSRRQPGSPPPIRPASPDFPIELDSGSVNTGGKVQIATPAPPPTTSE